MRAIRLRRALLTAALPATFALAAGSASAAQQQAYTVGLNYATPALAASVGDTLQLTNLDPLAQHNIVADATDAHGAPLFSSPLVADGASTDVAGVASLPAGTYTFHCALHSWMHGVLQVNAAPSVPTPPSPPPVAVPGPADLPNPADSLPHAAPVPLAAGQDWPFYGGDLGNSRAGGTAAPSWNEAPLMRPVWTFKSTNGDFTGTPVEADGTLVAVSGNGSVFALNASQGPDPVTGKPLWETDLLGPDGKPAAANGSAAIADGHVFVPLALPGGPQVVALSLADGKVQWRTTIDSDAGSDVYGSPIVWGGKVFIGTSGQNGDPPLPLKGSVVALDEATGALAWRTYTVGDPSSNADAASSNGGAVWSTPAVDPTPPATIYVGTGNAYTGTAAPTTDSVLALDAATGKIVRSFQGTKGDVFSTGGSGSNPAGVDYDFGASPQLMTAPNGEKLVGEGQKSGTYWVLDRATLTPVWSQLTGPGSPVGGIVGSTAYDGTRIYGPNSLDGEQWALNVADGSPAWVSSDGTPLHWGSTSVANGIVYTNDTSGVVTMREASTGAVLAKLPLGAPSWGGVAIAGGYVFAVTGTQGSSGWIVAYRPDPSGPATAAKRAR